MRAGLLEVARTMLASGADWEAVLTELRRLGAEWNLHDPLTDAQMTYADRTAVVKSVGFYHGGDVLYVLDGIPGVWHEPTIGGP